MTGPLVLPLLECRDPQLVGGKAAGLARLMDRGLLVPPGVCLTRLAYAQTLAEARIDIATTWTRMCRGTPTERLTLAGDIRERLLRLTFSSSLRDLLTSGLASATSQYAALGAIARDRWVVRSSATDEDADVSSFAGIYTSTLGVAPDDLEPAIVQCWASLWSARALAYRYDASPQTAPSMAVIVQPLLTPRAAGVAFSRDPVTADDDIIVINAVRGLGEPLVSGTAEPDHFALRRAAHGGFSVVSLSIAEKHTAAELGADGRIHHVPLPGAESREPSVIPEELALIAKTIDELERRERHPVDIEWALADGRLWLLQCRPITTMLAHGLRDTDCVWSRANFKETLPDVPSPLALWYLREYMEHNMLRHYREAGCIIPSTVSPVRMFRGRPYINVTLFQSLMAQLGGDPSLIGEHMGGQAPLPPRAVPRLPPWQLLWGGLSILRKVLSAPRRAPHWFRSLSALQETIRREQMDDALLDRLDATSREGSDEDLTFAIVSGVSLGLSVLELTLKRRTTDWRRLLNASLQGQGTIISANQIRRLHHLAALAAQDPTASTILLTEPWDAQKAQTAIAGTPFGDAYNAFLHDYGHRALGESDVMAPRFRETPEYHLGIVRQLLRGRASDQVRPDATGAARKQAVTEIRRAFGWRFHEWCWFRWWHRFLCRYLELREANRHYLMHYVALLRAAVLALGERAASQGVIDRRDDVFLLTGDELRELRSHATADWRQRVEGRRAERSRYAAMRAPDALYPGASPDEERPAGEPALRGMAVSAGYAEGPVRLIHGPDDLSRVRRGDILVTPVIDPGHAAVFSLAAGVIVEMGGTLSHGAIIAREYGIPAVANVPGAMEQLGDGDWVSVDAGTGFIRRTAPAPPH